MEIGQMGVNIENRFNKALRILDLGQIEKAELILNEIIIEAREKTDNLFLIRANCVLGELLSSMGRTAEAKSCLSEVITTPYDDDVVDYERTLAHKILKKLG